MIGKNYFDIPNDYRQVFGRPRFSLTRVSQVEVAREPQTKFLVLVIFKNYQF